MGGNHIQAVARLGNVGNGAAGDRVPSMGKIAITQGRAKGNKSNTPPPFKMK